MTALSRVLLFSDEADRITAALAAIIDAEPVTMRMTRLDGTAVTARLVEVNGVVIEVAPGASAAPALIELRAPDLAAATRRLTAASITTVVTPERGEARVRIGGLTVAVRQAEL